MQYGTKNQSASLFWYVYGYPKPTVKFFFNDEAIEMGGRYDFSYLRNGQLTLFVNRMLDRDAGLYEAVATNSFGEARQRIKLEVAEHPRFIERPEENIFITRSQMVQGLAAAGPVQPHEDATHSARHLHPRHQRRHHQRRRSLLGGGPQSGRRRLLIGDDSRRGQRGRIRLPDLPQGTTSQGQDGRSQSHLWRLLRPGRRAGPWNAGRHLPLCGEIDRPQFGRQDHDGNWAGIAVSNDVRTGHDEPTESQTSCPEGDIAHYVRQVLQGLGHMHSHGIAHLGLTPGDLFLTHPDGDELKIGDFGLARRIYVNKLASLDYGMTEFVAPETANGQGVGLAADLWSVGVITYLFLSGISPFRGHRYGSRHFAPRPDRPDQLNSNEAKDFLAKLLVFCADDRLTVEQVIDDFIDIYLNFVLIDFANIVGAGSSVAETGGSHCPRPLPDPNRAAEDLLRATQWRLSHLVQTPSAQRRFYSSVLHGVPARRRVHSEAVARTPPVHQKRGDLNYKIIIGNR